MKRIIAGLCGVILACVPESADGGVWCVDTREAR